LDQPVKDSIEIAIAARLHSVELKPQRLSRRLRAARKLDAGRIIATPEGNPTGFFAAGFNENVDANFYVFSSALVP